MRRLVLGVALGAAVSVGWASEVHTNPLNRDPLVEEAYQHFYNLDYAGAVERFERFHAAHPGDASKGAAVYTAACAGCHGANGQHPGPAGKDCSIRRARSAQTRFSFSWMHRWSCWRS